MVSMTCLAGYYQVFYDDDDDRMKIKENACFEIKVEINVCEDVLVD